MNLFSYKCIYFLIAKDTFSIYISDKNFLAKDNNLSKRKVSCLI